jgi:hypothetical protein
MQPLSSRSTWFYKTALPSGVFCGLCIFTFAPSAPLYGALAFGVAFCASAWFGHTLKNVTLGSGNLRLRGLFNEIDVPTSHLIGVVEHPWQRPQFVTLVFSPPTKWGRRVRMLTPIENFRYAVDTINSVIDKRPVPNHSPDPTLASGTSPAGQEPRHR